jgi:hypothetical protein
MSKFNRALSLKIDQLHHALEIAQLEPNQIKRLRKLLAIRKKLSELEKRIKV